MKLTKGMGKGWMLDPIEHGLAAKGIKTRDDKLVIDIGAGANPVEGADVVIDPYFDRKAAIDKHPDRTKEIEKIKHYKSLVVDKPVDWPDMKLEPAPKIKADVIHARYGLSDWGLSRTLPSINRMLKKGGKFHLKDYSRSDMKDEIFPITEKIVRNQAKRHGLKVTRLYVDKEGKIDATLVKK